MVIDLIAAVLAAWRLTNAINREKIGEPIRKRLAHERVDAVGLTTFADTFLSNLIMCFMCLSFWVGIFCTILFLVYPPFLYPLAISALVIFVDEVYQHG